MIQSAQSLANRAERIRLNGGEIARRAGLNKHSVYRALCGGADSRGSTLTKIAQTIEAEERAMLGHLVNLYGAAEAPQ